MAGKTSRAPRSRDLSEDYPTRAPSRQELLRFFEWNAEIYKKFIMYLSTTSDRTETRGIQDYLAFQGVNFRENTENYNLLRQHLFHMGLLPKSISWKNYPSYLRLRKQKDALRQVPYDMLEPICKPDPNYNRWLLGYINELQKIDQYIDMRKQQDDAMTTVAAITSKYSDLVKHVGRLQNLLKKIGEASTISEVQSLLKSSAEESVSPSHRLTLSSRQLTDVEEVSSAGKALQDTYRKLAKAVRPVYQETIADPESFLPPIHAAPPPPLPIRKEESFLPPPLPPRTRKLPPLPTEIPEPQKLASTEEITADKIDAALPFTSSTLAEMRSRLKKVDPDQPIQATKPMSKKSVERSMRTALRETLAQRRPAMEEDVESSEETSDWSDPSSDSDD